MRPDACSRESHASARSGVQGLSLLAEIALLSAMAALPASRAGVLVPVDLRFASEGCVPVEAEVRLRLFFEDDLPSDLSGRGLLTSVPEVGTNTSVLAAVEPLAEDADRGRRIGVSSKNPLIAAGGATRSAAALPVGRAIPTCGTQRRACRVSAHWARESPRLDRFLQARTATAMTAAASRHMPRKMAWEADTFPKGAEATDACRNGAKQMHVETAQSGCMPRRREADA